MRSTRLALPDLLAEHAGENRFELLDQFQRADIVWAFRQPGEAI